MAAATTDVREWLRSEGHEVPARGAIRQDLRDLYDEAHPDGLMVVAGDVISRSDDPVSDDDFPEPDQPAPAARPAPAVSAEQPPRPVRPSRKPKLPRIFGRRRKRGRRRGGERLPRVSLGDFAEDTWTDLAWLAQGIPPLAAMLELQAPYAGAVIDQQVQGTIFDDYLQPIARHAGAYRALNGLLGPPVCVLAICAEGRRDPHTRELDTRTKMMFGMLRYSLLQMTKVSEMSAEEIEQRTAAQSTRHQMVDMIIERLFGPVEQPPGDDDQAAAGRGGPPPDTRGYYDATMAAAAAPMMYPQPPRMDETGADPRRS